MTTRVDTEEIESTRSEKLLAVVLTAFLLVGTVWFYVQVGNWARDIHPDPPMTAAEQTVVDAAQPAWEKSSEADFALEDARTNLEVATPEERDEARAAYEAASAEARAASKAAYEAEEAASRTQEAYEQRVRDDSGGRDLVVALVRLVFVAGWTIGSFVLIGRMRQRDSRYLPLGFAAVGAGAVMSLVFLVDYITDWIDPLEFGPIVLSALGGAATVFAFVVLQRHLSRRIPGRRVRKGECPFCGFPVKGDGAHCEGCGREVIGECSTCSSSRRVGSPHCPTCGAA